MDAFFRREKSIQSGALARLFKMKGRQGGSGVSRGADWDSKWRLSIDLCTKCNFIWGREGAEFLPGGGRPPPPLATPPNPIIRLLHVRELVWQYNTKPVEFIDFTCTTMHGWFNYIMYCSQIVTLSCDQNEVFESLVLQSVLSTANFRESNRQKIFFFFFNIWLLLFD